MERQQHRLLEDLDDRPAYRTFSTHLGWSLFVGMMIGGLLTIGLVEVLGLGDSRSGVFFAIWILVALLIAILFMLVDVAKRTQSNADEQWEQNLLWRKEIARLDDDHDLLSLRVHSLAESRPDTMEEVIKLRKSMRELQREVRRSRRLDG